MDVTSFSTSTPTSHCIYSFLSDFSSVSKKERQNQLVWLRCYVSPFHNKRPSLALSAHIGSYVHRGRSLQVLCSKSREISTLEASCMDQIYDALADRLVRIGSLVSNTNLKHIIALAGPPGAGKSTLASQVARRVNELWHQRDSSLDSQVWSSDIAIVLPMDGFHLYRHQLDKMENPQEAHSRRGAPWTFDPGLLLSCLRTMMNQGSVYVPSFDHGVGDPVEEDIFVSNNHKVVIVEGNYLLLEEGIWKEVAHSFNEKWFVEVDIETAMQRVFRRHISTGKTPDIAKWRVEYNDRPNAELINKSKQNADLIIKSVSF